MKSLAIASKVVSKTTVYQGFWEFTPASSITPAFTTTITNSITNDSNSFGLKQLTPCSYLAGGQVRYS